MELLIHPKEETIHKPLCGVT